MVRGRSSTWGQGQGTRMYTHTLSSPICLKGTSPGTKGTVVPSQLRLLRPSRKVRHVDSAVMAAFAAPRRCRECGRRLRDDRDAIQHGLEGTQMSSKDFLAAMVGTESAFRNFTRHPYPPKGGGDGRVNAGRTFVDPLAAAKKILTATKRVGQ